MINHLIKLVWNRKKSMSLLLIEIFLSFVVAFVAYDMLITGTINYFSPLGYNYKNILDIRIAVAGGSHFRNLGAENSAKFRLLLNEIKAFPQVKQASFVSGNIPYGNMRINTTLDYNGKLLYSGINYVGDEYFETLQMSLVEGRWFSQEDIGALDVPIVIDENFKRSMFGEGNAIGENIQDPTDKEQHQIGTKYNIIGIVSTFRPRGELQAPEGEVFLRQSWDDSSYTPFAAMVKVQEGTSVSSELELQRRLASLAPDFDFRITPLSEAREAKLQEKGLEVLIPLIIALFLLFNVVLGLFGIFWQSISRRRGEIGLRRAMGGNSRSILIQLWGESIALGSLAILAGIPIVVNLAVLGLSKPIGSLIFFLSFICASGLIYLILTICAIYPSYLAARVQPAEALHNE